MSATRDELHSLADRLPGSEPRPALELIHGWLDESAPAERDLPFFASFEAEPDLTERLAEDAR